MDPLDAHARDCIEQFSKTESRNLMIARAMYWQRRWLRIARVCFVLCFAIIALSSAATLLRFRAFGGDTGGFAFVPTLLFVALYSELRSKIYENVVQSLVGMGYMCFTNSKDP